ncbi:RCC1 domain-containing protein [Streptomyces sp. BE133]|uniref:RCC1 domain-containing protein n=1 Tax=Streptomyces sp. BE133 TaxID=3002523 RepID=UPI002E7622CD|nr:RCC1 domain-containing protein [Streptomyces sp. BE133]MEE1809346.1 RCC1 domain-containing protein [Streptomyces sp. BE133]
MRSARTSRGRGSDVQPALTADGAVKSWGCNEYGQLGNDSLTDSEVPVESCSSKASPNSPPILSRRSPRSPPF